MGTSPVSNKKMMMREEKHEFSEVSENIIRHMVAEMLYPTVPEMTTYVFGHF